MNVTTTHQNGAAVVALSGDIDLDSSPQARSALLAAVTDASAERIVADLAAVSYIDSSGVASLVEALQKAKAAGKVFVLATVSDAARRVLELARLDRVFTIHATLEDALA